MKRKNLKKLTACMIAAAMLIGSSDINALGQTTNKADTTRSNTSTIAKQIDNLQTSSNAGTTGKTYAPSVQLAATAKYKEMDYSFLKTFAFGTTYEGEITLTFTNVAALKSSTLKALKAGVIVRTKGYYSSDDGGSAVYEISEKGAEGAEKLTNGLYANLIPDKYTDNNGKIWYVSSIKQYGAVGDGKKPENGAFYCNYARMSEYTNADDTVERGIAYVPAGEYKCDDQLFMNSKNINIVGDGDDTILFTDNDYRKASGYSEHFFTVWGASNLYLADFVLEAREVDLYNYMRQMSFLYASDIYVNNVDMLIPQECYNCYYYEDKQYSNFCCYTGNKNITADGCTMVQMTGTYRGANVGVLDIWSAGEENIVVMNCDITGNARDEQIGIFSTDKTSAYVHNVELINNTIHAYQPKYIDVVGNATMRFTLAYSDSHDIDNIHIAGNHFIVECDSKFMTFGKLKNCVIEDNILELMCTYRSWSIGIESNTYVDKKDVTVKHNDIFVSSEDGTGKGNLLAGNMTFDNNRVFSDVRMEFGILGSQMTGNEITALKPIGYISANGNVVGNTVEVYQGFTSYAGASNRQAATLGGSSETDDCTFSDNTIVNYERADTTGNFQSLFRLNGSYNSLTVNNNRYMCPNINYVKTGNYACVYYDEEKKDYKLRTFRGKSNGHTTVISNNVFQGVVEGSMDNDDNLTNINNTTLEFTKNLSDTVTSKVEIIYKGKPASQITTNFASIDFDDLEYVVTKTDEDGNVISEELADKDVKWYTSIEEIATVNNAGVVTRKDYGTVRVYAVPIDGSTEFGMCKLTFEKAKATSIAARDSITLQPGLKTYADCKVLP